MNEQQKYERAQNQFPKVPLEALIKIRDQIAEFDASTAAELMAEKEPELARFILTFSAGLYPPQFAKEFNTGAVVSWLLLHKLESEGYNFPKVGMETADAMAVEFIQTVRQFASLDFSSVESFSDLMSIFLEMKGSVEFNFPTVTDYADENQALMTFFSRLPYFPRQGAVVVYELKRRQFHANQLTAQFGDK